MTLQQHIERLLPSVVMQVNSDKLLVKRVMLLVELNNKQDMKSQETLSKIMELLNLQDEVKLESMKLENGTTIEAEAFEPNQEVFIITEEEEKEEIGYATKEELSAAVAEMKEIIEEIKAMMSPKQEEMSEEVKEEV